MQAISIQIIDRKIRKVRRFIGITGKITINDFWETFDISLAWWKAEDYERQWQQGINRIKNYDISCLVTSIHDPNVGPLIDWWLLYKEGTQIIINNHVLFREYYEEQIGDRPFTVENCYDFINPRSEELFDDGTSPSTWIVDISNSEWYNNL